MLCRGLPKQGPLQFLPQGQLGPGPVRRRRKRRNKKNLLLAQKCQSLPPPCLTSPPRMGERGRRSSGHPLSKVNQGVVKTAHLDPSKRRVLTREIPTPEERKLFFELISQKKYLRRTVWSFHKKGHASTERDSLAVSTYAQRVRLWYFLKPKLEKASTVQLAYARRFKTSWVEQVSFDTSFAHIKQELGIPGSYDPFFRRIVTKGHFPPALLRLDPLNNSKELWKRKRFLCH